MELEPKLKIESDQSNKDSVRLYEAPRLVTLGDVKQLTQTQLPLPSGPVSRD